MARRPVELADSTIAQCVLRAMSRLHAGGRTLLGPTLIGEEAAREYGKPIASTLVSMYLRRLAEAGDVSRHEQGSRRGLYRLVKKEL